MAKSKRSSVEHGSTSSTSPDTKPCFIKFMFPALTDLRIPPAFKQKYLVIEESHEWAIVTSPCGNWDIKMEHDEDGHTYFRQGWNEFIEHHSLGGPMHYLIFQYNGALRFNVTIYDQNGGKKNHLPFGTSCFTSSFPFFKSSLKDYSIGYKSFLLIPKAFSSKYIPGPKKMILKNSKGIIWDANIIIITNKNFSISAGWKAFADANELKKGDTCVFEFVDEDTIQVHIFK